MAAIPTTTLLSLLLLLGLSVSSASAACNADDKKALLAIKTAFNNNYHFASWTNTSDCCDWYDVDCDSSTGRVNGLSVFSDDKLAGTLSSAIGDLPYLTTVDFNTLPLLTGTIPSSIAKLTRLSFLRLSSNSLSGAVPSFSQLTALTYLSLANNKLTGTISGLSFPTGLTSLDMSHNMISGNIPAQVNKLTGLSQFNVSYNQLCGQIPVGTVTAKFDQYSYFHNKCLCGAPLAACTK